MMVGEQTIYLSHLPMFMFDPRHHSHNFQVILEVTLSSLGHPQTTYVNDRKQNLLPMTIDQTPEERAAGF